MCRWNTHFSLVSFSFPFFFFFFSFIFCSVRKQRNTKNKQKTNNSNLKSLRWAEPNVIFFPTQLQVSFPFIYHHSREKKDAKSIRCNNNWQEQCTLLLKWKKKNFFFIPFFPRQKEKSTGKYFLSARIHTQWENISGYKFVVISVTLLALVLVFMLLSFIYFPVIIACWVYFSPFFFWREKTVCPIFRAVKNLHKTQFFPLFFVWSQILWLFFLHVFIFCVQQSIQTIG